ncbi:MAG: diaminopimelate epimerase [Candidatus Eremiobacteraeota bacterium]|nr:diaminopimelate epimerase [Candidatus Eremiobacteraeota bacterium]
MTAGVPVTKMHGTRNDFLVIDQRTARDSDLREFARHYCERRSGIGADGVLVIEPSTCADVKMRIINADGSEAETCGNGLRCVARYLDEQGDGGDRTIETLAGVHSTSVVSRSPEFLVRVSMGTPIIERRDLPFDNAVFVSLGNPHVVLFAHSLDAVDLEGAAAKLVGARGLEGGANLHVAVQRDAGDLLVRHWERGVGYTQACGSGAIACAAAARSRGSVSEVVNVHVPGGLLRVEWDSRGVAYLTGPAERVFEVRVEATVARGV